MRTQIFPKIKSRKKNEKTEQITIQVKNVPIKSFNFNKPLSINNESPYSCLSIYSNPLIVDFLLIYAYILT